ncbi:MAG: mucoidy inhibitor MuiA family protein [Verrucomicrobiota bacterium]
MNAIRFVGAILAMQAGWLLAADPATAEGDSAKPVDSKITEVTVYADRAQVTRQGTATLGQEAAQYAFAKLPGWIDEGSIRVSLVPPDVGQVLDVQIHRTYLARASDEEFRKAEESVQEITDQIAALDDERAVLEAQTKQVDAMKLFSLEKLPKDSAVREVKPTEYQATVEFVTGSLRKVALAKRELEKKKRDLQPELNARQHRLEELRQRSQLEQRTVVVTASGRAGKAAMALAYMLPGATWEPVHELRASLDGRPVSVASYAVVRQTSGEDWNNVKLGLSSRGSTETMKIPELDALWVGGGRHVARVAKSSVDSFSLARKNFTAQNGLWFNANNNDAALQQEYADNQVLLIGNAGKMEQVFETLQQRGTTAHFPALSTQTIRTDGRPVRVPIGHTDLPAQQRILASPELSLNAARIADLTNSTRQPFLPGKVSLFLEGAFLGLTEVDFVAPGEPFSLYLGVADHLKLSRTLDKKRSELKRSGTRTKVTASFLVTVENFSDQPAVVQLSERVPVSENDEVKVSGIRISPDGKPDAKGLLHWELNLAAKQSREFRIEYNIEYPNDLTARKMPAQLNAPALHDQVKRLEKMF